VLKRNYLNRVSKSLEIARDLVKSIWVTGKNDRLHWLLERPLNGSFTEVGCVHFTHGVSPQAIVLQKGNISK
jgi:hypothetical protein